MTVIATGKCPLCGNHSEIEVPEPLVKKVNAYVSDRYAFGLVQEEFPELTPAQRETLLTGMHGDCFDNAFPEEEDG